MGIKSISPRMRSLICCAAVAWLQASAQSRAAGDLSDLLGVVRIQGSSGQLQEADRSLETGEKKRRMLACVRAAREFLDNPNEEVQRETSMLLSQYSANRQPVTEEQAIGQLSMSIVLSCYQNIDQSLVDEVLASKALTEAQKELVFSKWNSGIRPTKELFVLFESVVEEEQLRAAKEFEENAMIPSTVLINRYMPSRVKVVYVLAVLIGVFGYGLWSLQRLTRGPPARERSSKSIRCLEKVEARLERLEKKKRG